MSCTASGLLGDAECLRRVVLRQQPDAVQHVLPIDESPGSPRLQTPRRRCIEERGAQDSLGVQASAGQDLEARVWNQRDVHFRSLVAACQHYFYPSHGFVHRLED